MGKGKQYKKTEYEQMKQHARQLYEQEGKTFKALAEEIPVTKGTLQRWAKRYEWLPGARQQQVARDTSIGRMHIEQFVQRRTMGQMRLDAAIMTASSNLILEAIRELSPKDVAADPRLLTSVTRACAVATANYWRAAEPHVDVNVGAELKITIEGVDTSLLS